MGKKGEELYDFPMSEVFRRHYETNTPGLPRLRQTRPEKITVSGMTLNNIRAGDDINETNGHLLLENLQQLGIPHAEHPPPQQAQETKPASFSPPPVPGPLAPEQTISSEPPHATKGREPKKIPRTWHSDKLSPLMQVGGDAWLQGTLFSSEWGHQKTVWRRERRAEMGLPPRRALTWKELYMPLTKEQTDRARALGYHPERMRHGTNSWEKMLLAIAV